jgi:hypothetical protein
MSPYTAKKGGAFRIKRLCLFEVFENQFYISSLFTGEKRPLTHHKFSYLCKNKNSHGQDQTSFF